MIGYIKGITVKELWGFKDIIWEDIYRDVNILVGINGSGKTTLLNILYAVINEDARLFKKIKLKEWALRRSGDKLKVEMINTFDVSSSKSLKSNSFLTNELLDVIYTTGKGENSFFDYRLKASNFPDQAGAINENIQSLYKLINKQFSTTRKEIVIDPVTNKLVFNQYGNKIQLEDLSSGEKQFLLIIFKVFLMEKQPYILLMDEPEISLHIDWQHELINVIRELNPNCQVIISTHSPSIFGDGWGDRVVYMEDILK